MSNEIDQEQLSRIAAAGVIFRPPSETWESEALETLAEGGYREGSFGELAANEPVFCRGRRSLYWREREA